MCFLERSERVHISAVAVGELVRQWQGERYCPQGNTSSPLNKNRNSDTKGLRSFAYICYNMKKTGGIIIIMSSLESAKNKLDELLEIQSELYLGIRENYALDDDCEDATSVEEAIDEGEIDLEWNDLRDISYVDASVRCQKALVDALELLKKGDKKSIHNANKELEILVGEARRIRKSGKDDLRKAQEIISAMNEIIDVCDAHRQK